ncbi:hypothetical protein K9M79_04065 [Candidatus Woesearchaeota archaeon]|nr:hypothetical protein [Candidatus Woesearchaeota archaeon]
MKYAWLVCLILLVGGCTQTRTTHVDERYYTGIDGITMKFLTGSPPDTVYVDSDNMLSSENAYASDEYPFIIEFQNLGAYPYTQTGTTYGTAQASVYLSGFEQSLVELSSTINGETISVEGRNEDNPIGGYDTVEREARFKLPVSSTSYITKINAIACYNYGTLASGTICIDPDPSNDDNDVCSTHGTTFSGGQGAPVSVTSLEVEPMKNKVLVKINIKNSGRGEVVDKSKITECPFNLDYNEKGYVELETIRLGAQSDTQAGLNKGNCRPTKLRLEDGYGTIHCTLDVADHDAAFVTTLQVELGYGYKDSITKNINIKRI